ncbi:MAG: hypothetical protein MHM6MM_000320 [Cercozoa sp. M6MM]
MGSAATRKNSMAGEAETPTQAPVSTEDAAPRLKSVAATVLSNPEEAAALVPRLRHMGPLYLTKFVSITVFRFSTIYAGDLSSSADITEDQLLTILAIHEMMGVLLPLYGPVSDQLGHRRMFCSMLVLQGVASALLALCKGHVAPMAVIYCIENFAWNAFASSQQSALGLLLPPDRLQSITGMMESAWPLAAIVGFPVMGALVSKMSWEALWLLLGALCVVLGALCAVTFVPTKRVEDLVRESSATSESVLRQVFNNIKGMATHPATVKCMFSSMLLGVTQAFGFAMFNRWLDEVHHWDTDSRSLGTMTIGFGELVGAVGLSLIVKYFGLLRMAQLANLGIILSSVLFALTYKNVVVGLICYFFIMLTVELGAVSFIAWGPSLEMARSPRAFGTCVASVFATQALGRMIGIFLSPAIWEAKGMHKARGVFLVCAAFAALSLLNLVTLRVRPVEEAAEGESTSTDIEMDVGVQQHEQVAGALLDSDERTVD